MKTTSVAAIIAMAAAATTWTIVQPAAAQNDLHDHTSSATTDPPVAYPAYYPLTAPADDLPVKDNATGTPTAEHLLEAFLKCHTAMNYSDARHRAIDLVRLAPDRPEGYYNLACALARLRQNNDAMDALQRAVETGWRDHVHTALDPDLNALRSETRFAQILDDMRQRRRVERVTPEPLVKSSIEDVVATLDRSVPDLLKRYQTPGVTIAIIRDGECAWTGAYGHRDRTKQEPVTANDRWRLASVHDLLVGLAASTLHENGDLDVIALLTEADASGWRGTEDWKNNAAPAHRKGYLPRTPKRKNTPSLRWPASPGVDGTVRILSLAGEAATEQNVNDFCSQCYLNAHHLDDTVILEQRTLGVANVEPPTNDDEHNTSADPRPRALDMLNETRLAVLLHGHSALGTPLQLRQPGEHGDGPLVETNARDLATLLANVCAEHTIESTVNPNNRTDSKTDSKTDNKTDSSDHARPAIRNIANATNLTKLRDKLTARGHDLGIDVHLDKTPDGHRLQLAESNLGVGCFARLYPETGNGIVILFNSENGKEVALRIANQALGGR